MARHFLRICLLSVGTWLGFARIDCWAQARHEDPSFRHTDDLRIERVAVELDESLDLLIFEILVVGQAGRSVPRAAGQLDGAPVLGYVFPTTLKPTDVGFSHVEGIVALALTSHPDFDDTPLWDENMNRDYGDDGVVWHPHWVVLVEDERVEGGLAVRQFEPGDTSVVLPPTNPGMSMYMDSPGFPVVTRGNRIFVLVPLYRINRRTDFRFDGVTAYMEVNTSKPDLPMLGVYRVYSVASGDLSLPWTVTKRE